MLDQRWMEVREKAVIRLVSCEVVASSCSNSGRQVILVYKCIKLSYWQSSSILIFTYRMAGNESLILNERRAKCTQERLAFVRLWAMSCLFINGTKTSFPCCYTDKEHIFCKSYHSLNFL